MSQIIGLCWIGFIIFKQIINSFNPALRLSENLDLWKRLIKIDARLYWTCFCAGIAISQGKDPSPSLAWLANKAELNPFSTYISTDIIAQFIILGLLVPTQKYGDEYHKLWQRLAEPIHQFSIALERDGKEVWLVRRDHPLMEKFILRDIINTRPVTIGTIHAVRVEVTQTIEDLFLSSKEKLLYCTVEMEGEELGILELPIIDGMVSARVLKDAIAAKFSWEILALFFKYKVERDLTVEQKENNSVISRAKQFLVEKFAKSQQLSQQIHNKEICWTLFLQELWGITKIAEELLETDNLTVGETANNRKDLLVIEVSDQLRTIEVNTDVVDVLVTVGGSAIGVVTIAVPSRKLTPELLRAAVVSKTEFELCIVAVREGLLGKPLGEKLSLRERLAESRAVRTSEDNSQVEVFTSKFLPGSNVAFKQFLSLRENILVLGRLTQETIGTSASRWAMLPRATIKELTDTAIINGEPVIKIPQTQEEAKWVFYAPELILSSLVESPSLTSSHQLELNRETSISTYTEKLPILMYHQIIPSGSSEPERWKLTSEAFEEQLRYLRDNGFYSITLEDWRIAIMKRKPLPGKPIIITFDDGYLNFYDRAFPLLKKYGFGATVFLITDCVGETVSDNFKLMGWEQIKQLQTEGIEFGSHSATHPSLTALSYEEVVKEGARSRATLEQELGVPIRTLAYPYGDANLVVQHLIGACGYILGLGIGLQHSTFEDSLLKLSRIEVEGTDSLQKFALKISTPTD